jgi:D-mannonate dehydratase
MEMTEQPKPFVLRCLTKKRYNDIQTYLKSEKDLTTELIDRICLNICEIFEYDPDATTYTKEKGKQHSEWRRKKAEEFGVSVYKVCKGVKKLQIQKSS